MTPVSRAIWRQTAARCHERGQDRPILAAIEPAGLLAMRPKGLRTVRRMPIDVIYWISAKAEAEARRSAVSSRSKQRGRGRASR